MLILSDLSPQVGNTFRNSNLPQFLQCISFGLKILMRCSLQCKMLQEEILEMMREASKSNDQHDGQDMKIGILVHLNLIPASTTSPGLAGNSLGPSLRSNADHLTRGSIGSTALMEAAMGNTIKAC